jgi:intein/homing endonuclease
MFDDFLDALKDNPFIETPVDVKTFVEGEDYLAQPPLSSIQYDIVEAMSQIYRLEELQQVMGTVAGQKHHKKYTKNELILMLGKGCHAPYTPTFNPVSGKWERLDSLGEGLASTIDGNVFATESFAEGFGQMVRVRTSLGFTEDVYVGHKYWTMKKNKFYKRVRDGNVGEFKEVLDISVGDRIGILLNMNPTEPLDIPDEHAELIGYWLGDGMMPTDSNPIINVDFSSQEEESIKRYLELSEIVGDTPTQVNHKVKKMVSLRHGRNSNAVRIAKGYGLWGTRSATKSFPDELWKSSNRVLSKAISKLWQTDGCVYSKNGNTAEFVSVSKKLADDVHKGLLRLGVPSTLRSRIPKSNFPNASRAYYVTVSSQESMNAFTSVISLLDHKKTLPMDKGGRVYARIDNDVYWDRVVSIEPLEDAAYWTRTVPGQGHYAGNGMLSANSGKDFVSTVACAYVVYKLLCLKDPARYYGKPSGDAIDIINIAINAAQAKNVFFKGFRTKIEKSPWFAGKYYSKADSIEFDHSITVYSGHSERESHEGLNLLMAVLDEISGFATEVGTGNDQGKTADNIYKAFRASVDSRFPDVGKVVLLSFPRYPGDFISQRYDSVILEKEVISKSHSFIMNDELPEDMEGNSLDITWDEDTILSYKIPGVFAIKRPTWVVNPTRRIEDFKLAFYTDLGDAMMRFACIPTYSSDAFFKQADKVRSAMTTVNPLDTNRRFLPNFKPDPDKKYFIHADLAQLHDKCAVAIAHVDKWVNIQVIKDYQQVAPIVVVDAVAWWEPKVEGPVNLSEVKQWIQNLRRLGFDIGMVSFDRWQSFDIQNELKQVGIRTETVSVAKKHYEDMAMLIYEDRLAMPAIDLLFEELTELKIVKQNRVDHPRKKSKDLADAVCGAIFGAISHTPKDTFGEIEVHTFRDRPKTTVAPQDHNVVQLTPKEMPNDIKDYLDSFGYL